MYLVAKSSEHFRRCQAAWPGPDNADRFRPLVLRMGRLDPAIFERGVGNVPLYRANGDRFEALFYHTIAFTQ